MLCQLLVHCQHKYRHVTAVSAVHLTSGKRRFEAEAEGRLHSKLIDLQVDRHESVAARDIALAGLEAGLAARVFGGASVEIPASVCTSWHSPVRTVNSPGFTMLQDARGPGSTAEPSTPVLVPAKKGRRSRAEGQAAMKPGMPERAAELALKYAAERAAERMEMAEAGVSGPKAADGGYRGPKESESRAPEAAAEKSSTAAEKSSNADKSSAAAEKSTAQPEKVHVTAQPEKVLAPAQPGVKQRSSNSATGQKAGNTPLQNQTAFGPVSSKAGGANKGTKGVATRSNSSAAPAKPQRSSAGKSSPDEELRQYELAKQRLIRGEHQVRSGMRGANVNPSAPSKGWFSGQHNNNTASSRHCERPGRQPAWAAHRADGGHYNASAAGGADRSRQPPTDTHQMDKQRDFGATERHDSPPATVESGRHHSSPSGNAGGTALSVVAGSSNVHNPSPGKHHGTSGARDAHDGARGAGDAHEASAVPTRGSAHSGLEISRGVNTWLCALPRNTARDSGDARRGSGDATDGCEGDRKSWDPNGVSTSNGRLASRAE